MPELPEVETVVRTLQPLVGRRVEQVRVLQPLIIRSPGALPKFLRSQTIRTITRQAKRIIIQLRNPKQLVVHLGMTGRLVVTTAETTVEKHTHVRIGMGHGEELRLIDPRRFGGVWMFNGSAGTGEQLSEVGVDALTVTIKDFTALLQRRRQIKALLLDQKIIAGLGNIYSDEALFRAGIHPHTLAGKLPAPQVKALHRALRLVLHSAIRLGGSTIRDYRTPNGEQGWFQIRHQVYGREGQPCKRCGTPIQRILAAGRSSHICPHCQR
ncbi:MAG: Formamidopyrimidine-DNA glycosylase [Phycisphaerae bacterium]|nr:Formamidopyrimidine-DNA glycosylase [Phycisphaerae bacterium]